MKQSKKKLKDKSQNKFEWLFCPLFCALPPLATKYIYPNSIALKCAAIISEIRSIFGIDGQWLNPKSLDPAFIERKTGFPQDKILSARAIYGRSDRIIDDAQDIAENWEPIRTKNGMIHKFDPHQIDIDLLRSTVDITSGVIDSYEFEDYEILLMIALAESWNLMEDVLEGDYEDDDVCCLQNIRVIESLFLKAKEIYIKNKNKKDRQKGPQNRRNDIKEFCKYMIKKSKRMTDNTTFDYLKNNHHQESYAWKIKGRGIYHKPSKKFDKEKGSIIVFDLKTKKIFQQNNFKSFQRNFKEAKDEINNKINEK